MTHPPSPPTAQVGPWITATKQQLRIDRLALQIHDACFPSDPDEETGRGSPYSRGAERFCAFAAEQGFDALQLGPQGMTDRGNPSPYDGTLFSRNPLNLPWARLVEQGRLRPQVLASMVAAAAALTGPSPEQIHDIAHQGVAELLELADATDQAAAGEFLAANESWLVPDALYKCLCAEHRAGWWREWDGTAQGAFDQRLFDPAPGDHQDAARRLEVLRQRYQADIEDYALVQWTLDKEHQALRKRLAQLGLTLYADLQVGLAPQDVWARRSLFLTDYRVGAPPSRTNPDGQPWGYFVLDPAQFGTRERPGPALRFVQARLNKVLMECDGVRIDHPHGWVDPWVYRADDQDPFHAVQNGGRLFSSPAEPSHPALRAFAIARADQIDREQLPYADRRVTALDDAQVSRYAMLVGAIVERVRSRGPLAGLVACEVLSTLPYPVQRVIERYGVGRFRVIQKAKLDDPSDVYRIEHAALEDWIMLGTHDTPTVWELAPNWCQGEQSRQWAAYLAPQLAAPAEQAAVTARLASNTGELVHGIFAALLASRARHVSVFFPDLLGMTERYNRPGVVGRENWSLRVPPDFARVYEDRRRRGESLDVIRCLGSAVAHNPPPE